MTGFTGFNNGTLMANNVDFRQVKPVAPQMVSNGQLLIGSAISPNIQAGVLTSPNGTLSIGYSSPNITIDLIGGLKAVSSLSDDVNNLTFPNSSNNIQIQGHVVEQGSSKFSTVIKGTNLLSINPMSTARWIVDPLGFNGTHTTIISALNSATSGDEIVLMPATYTEDPVFKAGVNITAYGADSSLNGTGTVIIKGKCTFTTAGSVTLSGIQLQTNSDFCLAVTGSAASIVNLNNCYINALNNTAISFTSSSSSARLNIMNCSGNIGTTGIAYLADSSTGNTTIAQSLLLNTGGSTTANTKSAGALNIFNTSMNSIWNYSSSNTSGLVFQAKIGFGDINATALTTSGTGTINFSQCDIFGGSSSAISVGSGTTVSLWNSTVSSSNTNAITGAGAFNFSNLAFSNSSSTINVTTQTNAGAAVGLTNAVSPAAGRLGERISSAVTAVSFSNTVAANVTSINITPGVWDISINGHTTNTSGLGSAFVIGIGTTSATFAGNQGDQLVTTIINNITQLGACLSGFRATLSATTTYYFVAQVNFTGGTSTIDGRITATRVG